MTAYKLSPEADRKLAEIYEYSLLILAKSRQINIFTLCMKHLNCSQSNPAWAGNFMNFDVMNMKAM